MEEPVLDRPYLQGTADSRLRHNPCLSVEEAYLLVQELQSEGQASGLGHI